MKAPGSGCLLFRSSLACLFKLYHRCDDANDRANGKRADKVRKLYNGMIPAYLYQYFKK